METLKFVMTTTFYPPHHIGGDALYVYHLANELAKLGHEIHVIYSIESYGLKRKSTPKNEFQNHENIHVYPVRSPIGRTTPIISYILGTPYPIQNKIAKLIEKIKADVIHHHNIAGFGPFILKMGAPKVLYTAHDYWLVCPMNSLLRADGKICNGDSNCFMCSILHKRPPQLWRYTGYLAKALENVDIIITPSRFMKDKLVEFGIERPIEVIYNFIPNIQEKTEENTFTFPYFLFVGVLERHKGVLELIDAFSAIRKDINAKLVIVGSGSLEGKIKKTIKTKNLGNEVMLTGRISSRILFNLYENALATIVPSIWPENNPLVALESISMGTPIITSNKGGLPEITEKIDPKLIFSTFEELQSILVNFDKAKYDANKIKNIYKTNFSFNAYYRKYIELIKGDGI